MRGDKRRTYRFQDDTVVDHVTGKSVQASKAMKGGVCRLWQWLLNHGGNYRVIAQVVALEISATVEKNAARIGV